MKLGLILPNTGPGASSETMDLAAAAAERLGWNSVWMTDHLLVPRGDEAEQYGRTLEAITALSWIAGRHESVALGFSVLIPAMRDAPLLAKQLATLDVLSGGRLTVGVGSSERHDLPEYQNLGKADRFPVRGRYLDETIRLWRHLWGGASEPFRGEFHELQDFVFDPLPVQGESLPIWCGGRSDRVLRRAVELCDGYHAAQTGPADVAERIPKLRALTMEAGRPPLTISVRVRVRIDREPLGVYSLHGETSRIADEIAAFAEAGVDELVVIFSESEPVELVEAIERFHTDAYLPATGRVAR